MFGLQENSQHGYVPCQRRGKLVCAARQTDGNPSVPMFRVVWPLPMICELRNKRQVCWMPKLKVVELAKQPCLHARHVERLQSNRCKTGRWTAKSASRVGRAPGIVSVYVYCIHRCV